MADTNKTATGEGNALRDQLHTRLDQAFASIQCACGSIKCGKLSEGYELVEEAMGSCSQALGLLDELLDVRHRATETKPLHVWDHAHPKPELLLRTPKGNPVKIGDRVRLIQDVDRYPHFIAKRGMTGTLVTLSGFNEQLSVRLDVTLEGAEEWDNCVILSDEENFDDYFEVTSYWN